MTSAAATALATARARYRLRSAPAALVSALLLWGTLEPAAAQVAFEHYEVVTGTAPRQTVLTGFLLGGPVADLVALSVDESGERRVQLYAFDGGTWAPTFETGLGSEVSFVDVAAIDGRDWLIACEPGRIRALDLESGTSRALVAVDSSFDPPRGGPIPHADVTRDVNGDGRDDLVVPAADGFRVFVQTGDGAFADPVTVGPPAELARIYGADGSRFDPWSQSRIHEIDFDGDGRRDFAFWNGDRFEVRRQNPSGLFSADTGTFTTDVAFDSDDRSWLAAGDTRGRVLDALTDVNGDGVADLVIASLQGRRLERKRSTTEVYFGRRTRGGGIAFGPAPDTVIGSDGVQLGIQRHDLDRDGQLDMMVTTIGTELLRGTLFRRFAGFMGGEIHLQLEFFRMDGGHYPDAPDATRRINLQYPGAHRGPGWVPLDLALRGATHERRLVETTHPRAFDTPVLLGDVSGDGRADLIVGRDRGEPPGPRRHADDSLHVFVGEPGPGLFSRQPHEVVVPLPEDGEHVWLTDLDGDGRQDVVMHHPAAAEPHRVTVLKARQVPAPAPPD